MNVKEYMGGGPEEGIPGFSDQLQEIDKDINPTTGVFEKLDQGKQQLEGAVSQMVSMSMYQAQGQMAQAGENVVGQTEDMQKNLNQQVEKQMG